MKLNKKIFKKFLIILTMLMFSFTMYKISQTCALLESATQSKVTKEIGKWNIKLNEEDITNGLTQDIVINNFLMSENENVKDGKIAPGVSGSLELTLDPQDTEVSVRYDISLGDIDKEQIKLNSVELIEGTGALVKTAEGTYSGIMNLSEITNKTAKTTIKLSVLWENDENNNVSDTVIGTQKGYNLEIPITINVSQYLGEKLDEYVSEGV